MLPAPPVNPAHLKGKYVFLDNDFLGSLFSDPELLAGSLDILGKESLLFIDGFTRIEFLRDVWLPEIREQKELFLSSELFSKPMEHQLLYQQVRDNALILSRLYAHSNPKSKLKVSTVDLLLAGTLMFYKNSMLVTGNKKDFPSNIFKTIGVMNFEQGDGGMKCISVVAFDPERFSRCESNYNKVPKSS